MSHAEIVRVMSQIGLTRGQLSEILGVSTRTITRWRNGDTPVPLAVAYLLRSLAADVEARA